MKQLVKFTPKAYIMRLIVVIASTVFLIPAQAADLAREQRLADEVEAALVIGDAVYLEAEGQEFLALFAESETETAKGAVLVLHGRGLHPNWPQVTAPLRTELIDYGWHTLAIQLPVLQKGATYYDYVPLFAPANQRIKAAVRYLQEQEIERIILIAHSCGVHMSMAYIDAVGDQALAAYIGIGMGATDRGQQMAKSYPLQDMNIPVLALHGSDDYPSVQRHAPDVLAGLDQAGHGYSRQQVIASADHNFTEQAATEVLVETVVEWLEELP